MKKLNKIASAIFASALIAISFSGLKAETSFGVSIIAGQTDISGTEFENGGTTDKNTASFEEMFVGGSIFLETEAMGMVVGIDYVPLDIELGSGSRTDTNTGTGSNATSTQKASADLTDLITLYVNYPVGDNGYYLLGGIHSVTVKTAETLQNASYANEDIYGGQFGFGKKVGNLKYEAFYSDFEDISISSTGGSGEHSISADADALGFKISYGF
tara:strand:+ start:1058 stop:1702 length:645 start_codon:yes stop_codon:yes gene_type:complete